MSVTRFYIYRDMILIPTVARAEEGFYLDHAPVIVCDIAEKEKFRQILENALQADNVTVVTPQPADEPGSVILEHLGLKKWLTFETEAVMYTIHANADKFECYSTGRAVNGTWKMMQSKHMTFLRGEGIDRVINSIILDMDEERKAAVESKVKPGGLMLLPAPAQGEHSGHDSD